LMLSDEATDDTVSPRVFDLSDGNFVLAFDRVERLSQFAGGAACYIALSGRVLSEMLIGQRLGLGLNLDVAPSSILIPPDAVAWLHETLGNAPDPVEEKISSFAAPGDLPERLLVALDTKLATAEGLAQSAYLVSVEYDDGGQGHLLGFVNALDHAHGALAQAISETLTFSGIEAGALDVAFFDASDPVSARLARVGLRFDLPRPPEPAGQRPAPGSDPEKPPILR
ncbi:MAG: SseB family protein, partial [Pseudomonadota bacterium]